MSPASTVAERGRAGAFLRLVTIEHSVFALPFAYVAALTAMVPDVRWGDLGLVTLAMVAARTFAMAANRIIAAMFETPEIAYLHAHYAKRGCFAARIDRP